MFAVAVSAALGGCGHGTGALSEDQANVARSAIVNFARDEARRYPAYTTGARVVLASHDCYASTGNRIYCQVAFEGYAQRADRWCSTGYTATADGHDVRRVRVGDPTGPGWECGSFAADGDPFS